MTTPPASQPQAPTKLIEDLRRYQTGDEYPATDDAMERAAEMLAALAARPATAAEGVLGWRVEGGPLGPAFTHHQVQADLWIKEGRTVTALAAQSAAAAAGVPSDAGVSDRTLDVIHAVRLSLGMANPGAEWVGYNFEAFLLGTFRAMQRHLAAQTATQPASEAPLIVEYQYRMRADWQERWLPWIRCEEGTYTEIAKMPHSNDWNYEVRALALATPAQPAPAPGAGTEHFDAFAQANTPAKGQP